MHKLSRRATSAWLASSALALALPAVAQAKPLTIGVSNGPMSDILNHAIGLAKKDGLDVRTVLFTDWVSPNEALRSGDLDANLFQNQAFLDTQKAARGYKFSVVGRGVILPSGLYSRKLRDLASVPAGGRVAIANDPLNSARGLLLLHKAGLIRLKDGTALTSTVRDIVANPKNLEIIQVEGPQLARVLDDVALAAIGLTILIPAGIDPKTALLSEDFTQNEFAVSLVARDDSKSDPRLARFVAHFNSAEAKAYVNRQFPAFIAAW